VTAQTLQLPLAMSQVREILSTFLSQWRNHTFYVNYVSRLHSIAANLLLLLTSKLSGTRSSLGDWFDCPTSGIKNCSKNRSIEGPKLKIKDCQSLLIWLPTAVISLCSQTRQLQIMTKCNTQPSTKGEWVSLNPMPTSPSAAYINIISYTDLHRHELNLQDAIQQGVWRTPVSAILHPCTNLTPAVTRIPRPLHHACKSRQCSLLPFSFQLSRVLIPSSSLLLSTSSPLFIIKGFISCRISRSLSTVTKTL
jgi:hypothetical protein